MDKLNGLSYNTREKYLYLAKELRNKYGLVIFLTSGYRTAQEQNALYQQGRTQPWPIVTYVDGYNRKSSHQHWVAFDIAFRGKELYPTDDKVWENVAKIAKNVALDRGYDMRGRDKPHFQNTKDRHMDIHKSLYISSSDNTITTMRWFDTVSHNQKIKVAFKNKPSSVHAIKYTILIRNVLRNIWQHISTPIIEVEDGADIEVYFAKQWDKRMPVPFKNASKTLWYGLAPWLHDLSGKMFINDAIEWDNIDNYRLRLVLEHEMLHCLNIWHSSNPDSIMYPLYRKWEHDKIYDDALIELLQKLY